MLKIPKSSQVKIFYKKGPSLESGGSCLSHLTLDIQVLCPSQESSSQLPDSMSSACLRKCPLNFGSGKTNDSSGRSKYY